MQQRFEVDGDRLLADLASLAEEGRSADGQGWTRPADVRAHYAKRGSKG